MFLTNVISVDGNFGALSAHVDIPRVFNVIFDDVMAVAITQRFVRFVDSRVNLLPCLRLSRPEASATLIWVSQAKPQN